MDNNDKLRDSATRALIKQGNIRDFFEDMWDKGKNIRFHNKATDAAAAAAKDSKMPRVLGMPLHHAVGVFVAAIGINEFVRHMLDYAKGKALDTRSPSYYKKMLEKHPELMEEDPEEVMDLWNTLFHHSYHTAKDPIAAGAWIRQNIKQRFRQDLGGPPPDAYKALVDIDSTAIGARQKRLGTDVRLSDALIAGLGIGS